MACDVLGPVERWTLLLLLLLLLLLASPHKGGTRHGSAPLWDVDVVVGDVVVIVAAVVVVHSPWESGTQSRLCGP